MQVWGDAKKLVMHIYSVTKEFPHEERFGLASQMNRAVVSVASNLAEGSSRTSFRDQAHFSQLAFSSLMETACQAIIAKDLNLISDENYFALRKDIEALSIRLNALRSSQIKRLKS